ncbi:hypothetical protein D9757_007676 [Collybiopsis confluens]|uniref:SWI5-dependent HO expression protein 3 n=1 Tax=Collybiopsis confluens TaxID=2823264 RepID=A0A8H5M3I8_9AGAR|nr:hypothetical protein D9757_007676 [Collybiopsis confluens]
MNASPPPSSFSPRISKRSSYEVLQGIAGPDSNLPLPSKREDDVQVSYKRLSSPTRTLSRIPVSSVGNARALADEGAGPSLIIPNGDQPPAPATPSSPSLHPPPLSPSSSSSPSSSNANKRVSLTPGGTTKVLADLQTGVINARNALENTKAQLRLSQRSVASLTRQTEDLKEGRERLRLENEGLNNVVARKERLLQEVLERARKAESEATQLRTQLKSETSQSKKSLRDMEHQVAESTALSQKSEREYLVLRDSLKHLTDSWKHDTDRLRDEIKKREEKWKAEAEVMGKKYRKLVEEVQASRKCDDGIRVLREEERKTDTDVEEMWTREIQKMRKAVEKSGKEGEDVAETARQLSAELTRLRSLMQSAGRALADVDLDSSFTLD